MKRYLLPTIAGILVAIPGSAITAYRMGRKLRLGGPGAGSWTPFVDAWTQTIQVWVAIGFFAFVAVFVLERWLEDRASARARRTAA